MIRTVFLPIFSVLALGSCSEPAAVGPLVRPDVAGVAEVSLSEGITFPDGRDLPDGSDGDDDAELLELPEGSDAEDGDSADTEEPPDTVGPDSETDGSDAVEPDVGQDDVDQNDVDQDAGDEDAGDVALEDTGSGDVGGDVDPDADSADVEPDLELLEPDVESPDTEAPDVGDEDTGFLFVPPAGEWTQAAPLLAGREQAAIGAFGGVILVAGGRDFANAVVGTLQSYSVVGDVWAESLKPMPTPRTAAAAGIVVDPVSGGRLFVAGGNTADGAPSQLVERYNPGTQSWAAPPTGLPKLPSPTCCGTGIGDPDSDRLWVFGGAAGSTNTWSHQPAAGVWLTHPAMPTGRSFPAVAAIDHRFVVIGGGAVDAPQIGEPLTAATEIFDPATEEWSALPPAPIAVYGAAAVGYAGRVWLFGGRLVDGSLSDAVWVLDLELGWAPAQAMPRARVFHGAVSTVEGLWLIGGFGTEGLVTAVDRLAFP